MCSTAPRLRSLGLTSLTVHLPSGKELAGLGGQTTWSPELTCYTVAVWHTATKWTAWIGQSSLYMVSNRKHLSQTQHLCVIQAW